MYPSSNSADRDEYQTVRGRLNAAEAIMKRATRKAHWWSFSVKCFILVVAPIIAADKNLESILWGVLRSSIPILSVTLAIAAGLDASLRLNDRFKAHRRLLVTIWNLKTKLDLSQRTDSETIKTINAEFEKAQAEHDLEMPWF